MILSHAWKNRRATLIVNTPVFKLRDLQREIISVISFTVQNFLENIFYFKYWNLRLNMSKNTQVFVCV